MSSEVFPTRWPPTGTNNSLTPYVVPDSVRKVPLSRTATVQAANGSEYRVNRMTGRFRYEFNLNGLDSTTLGTVRDFYAARQGAFDSFYLEDPDTKSLVLVRFDQDELEFTQAAPGLWATSIRCVSLI